MSKTNSYVGTKNVIARPMNRQEYNDYRGWELPLDEDGTDLGMLVEHIDGGESNHKNHEGYISWSPMDVFDKSYKSTGTFAERLLVESQELAVKLNALNSFMSTSGFVDLSRENKNLLYTQSRLMNEYLQVLGIRLEISGKKFTP